MPKKSYEGWSREELIEEISKLQKRKRYGIVWEEKPEEVVVLCRRKLPVLAEDRGRQVTIDATAPAGMLIEGDNYHALSVLNYTHKGRIDAIYIDPPFNTGAANWKYNNDFVDKDDAFRHSKWLSFMDKRLRLAKALLKTDGVLICAIDENELWHLGSLLEEIFHSHEIHLITIVHNPRGVQGGNFSYINEYAFFVIPRGKKVIGRRKLEKDEIYWSNLRNWGGESLRTDARNCFYPILVQDDMVVGFGDVPPDEFHPQGQTEMEGGKSLVWPIDVKGIERKWRYARQSVETVKHLLETRSTRGRIEIFIGKDYGIVRTVWHGPKYDAAEYGTKLVHALVPDDDFEFPKSIYNVYDCLEVVVGERKDALVLDYFAGSGTTGHAVMMLNKDGGKRRFILCTNNEGGIAERVCYPRIRRVIEGHPDYADITNLPCNLRYFRTDFVDAEPTDSNKKKLVDKSTEMLCLREDCFEEIRSQLHFRIFTNCEGKLLGIVYDDEGINPLKEELKGMKSKAVVYVFSLDESARQEEFEDMRDLVELKPIPAVILNVYKRIFR